MNLKFDSFYGPGRPSVQDRVDIGDVISAVTLFIDTSEFDKLEELFAADAIADYRGVFGGEITPVRTQIEAMKTWFPGCDSAQHLVTNHDIRVSGDEATARAHVQATHCIGTRFWTVSGMYFFKLRRENVGWKITMMGAKPLFEQGDRSLLEEAAARVRERKKSGV